MLRPSACTWNPAPGEADTHQFVYIVPSRLDNKERLLFIKYYGNALATENKNLVYCGTISVLETTVLLNRLKHIRKIRKTG